MSLHREPFSLTSCGRTHRNCLIHIILPGWFSSRFNNFLIRTCVCSVKGDETSTMRSRTVVPEVSRWTEIKLNRFSYASSTPNLALDATCRGSMQWATYLISRLINVSATGRKSLNCLVPCLWGNGHNGTLSVALNVCLKATGKILWNKWTKLIRANFHNMHGPASYRGQVLCFWVNTWEASDNIPFDQCYRAGALCLTTFITFIL